MAGACNTPNGGSDDIHLIDHCRALAGCHGHLQSESGPSWLLHGPAGQLRRAVLSTRRKASSSVPQEELEPAREPSLAGPCTAFNAAALCGVWRSCTQSSRGDSETCLVSRSGGAGSRTPRQTSVSASPAARALRALAGFLDARPKRSPCASRRYVTNRLATGPQKRMLASSSEH